MSDQPSPVKQRYAEMFRQYLMTEGYRPTVDEDGDVVFKSEGATFLIILDEKDSEFFRLAAPNFWSIEDEEEREQVKAACLEVTKAIKVAKVFPVRDNTWATIEMFVSPIQSVQDVFGKCLRGLHHAMNAFRKEMHSLQGKAGDFEES